MIAILLLLTCFIGDCGDRIEKFHLRNLCKTQFDLLLDSGENITVKRDMLLLDPSKDTIRLPTGRYSGVDVSELLDREDSRVMLVLVDIGEGGGVPMVLLCKTYGLWLRGVPGTRDSRTAFNVLTTGLKSLNLAGREEILMFIDFYLRMITPSSRPTYRINSIEDIWAHQGFVRHEDVERNHIEYYNRQSKELMVENSAVVKDRPDWIKEEAVHSASRFIYPAKVKIEDVRITVNTLAWDAFSREILELTFVMAQDGSIDSVNSTLVYSLFSTR